MKAGEMFTNARGETFVAVGLPRCICCEQFLGKNMEVATTFLYCDDCAMNCGETCTLLQEVIG